MIRIYTHTAAYEIAAIKSQVELLTLHETGIKYEHEIHTIYHIDIKVEPFR
jgi:hypothetical protein